MPQKPQRLNISLKGNLDLLERIRKAKEDRLQKRLSLAEVIRMALVNEAKLENVKIN